MPRRTRRQLVGRQEHIDRARQVRQLAALATVLHRQWTNRKESR
jgi:hypothetical protein